MPDRLPSINFRTTSKIRKMIEEAAAQSGRSMSAEMVSRLEKTFWEDDLMKKLGPRKSDG